MQTKFSHGDAVQSRDGSLKGWVLRTEQEWDGASVLVRNLWGDMVYASERDLVHACHITQFCEFRAPFVDASGVCWA